jgi:lactate dehydrogenase-like 2-hydroxyacid dehydrogenase
MTRVLSMGRMKPSLAEALSTKYEAPTLPPPGPERDAWLRESGAEVRVLVSTGSTPVDAALLDRLPALEAVVNFGVGYDHLDVEAAHARGIAVSNTPDVLDDAVADTAVALVLDLLRGFTAADRWVRAGRWPSDGPYPLTRDVRGARVGILGLGRIGRAVATRLEAFGCVLSYHNRHRRDDVAYAYAGSPAELAAGVDVLVVAAAGGSGTVHLVDRPVLEALGPEGYLVNIARGTVVDQDALVALLCEGGLAGAGLDVFADEPHVPEELVGLENVVLLPHLASGTVETRAAMERLVLENLDRVLADGTLVTPVP